MNHSDSAPLPLHLIADFDYWKRLETWKLSEAILLLLSVEPRAEEAKTLSRIAGLVGRRTREFYPSYFDEEPFYSLQSAARQIHAYARAAKKANLHLFLDSDGDGDGDPSVSQADWIRWAASKELPVPDMLVPEKHATKSPVGPWPWGTRETKLLRHLADAAREWWRTYDPDDPTTAPTNKDVSGWLKKEGVGGRVAEVMAQILRDDHVLPGPRTTAQKKDASISRDETKNKRRRK